MLSTWDTFLQKFGLKVDVLKVSAITDMPSTTHLADVLYFWGF